MKEQATELVATQAIELLTHYSLDTGGYLAEELVADWVARYSVSWIRMAIVEALYQGRYKTISVEHILNFWERRGQPIYHFNHEFERIICAKFSIDSFALPIANELSELEDESEVKADPIPSEVSNCLAPAEAVWEEVQLGEIGATKPFDSDSFDSDSSEAGDRSIVPNIEESLSINPELRTATPSNQGESVSLTPVSDPSLTPLIDLAEHTSDTLAIQSFQPDTDALSGDRISWSRGQACKYPIHQFIPTVRTSEFYSKLKAVAHSDGNEGIATNMTLIWDAQAGKDG
jgi:hypothetical protein